MKAYVKSDNKQDKLQKFNLVKVTQSYKMLIVLLYVPPKSINNLLKHKDKLTKHEL